MHPFMRSMVLWRSRGFTIFWVFPVTSIVGLVSIQNISAFWPGLVRVSVLQEQQIFTLKGE